MHRTYLGHLIGQGGVRPEQSKIRAIQEMQRPQTKKQVRSFLGMVGYYRRFLPHFATKAEPLTALTKKGLPEKVAWTETTERAFKILKKDLVQSVKLKNPDFSQTFLLQTDASNVGIGAVLSQGSPNDQPIAYYSRKLLDREKKYSAVEKECLAILLGVKAFATYLIGRPFVLQTDNRALVWLNSFRERNARLTRWSLALQPYTFTVQHRKGKDNANADALSHLPMLEGNGPCFALAKGSRDVTDCGNDPATDPDQLNQLANGLIKEPIKHQLDHGEQDSRRPKGCSDKDQLPPVDDPIHPLGDCQTTESTKEISPTYDI